MLTIAFYISQITKISKKDGMKKTYAADFIEQNHSYIISDVTVVKPFSAHMKNCPAKYKERWRKAIKIAKRSVIHHHP
jgi:hypothetical protein